MKQQEVIIKFKIDEDMSKESKMDIIYDLINEIQDRYMYVTEVKIDNEKVFEFDDTKFNKEVE